MPKKILILTADAGFGHRSTANAILYVEMQKTIESGHFEHADLVQMEEHVLTVADTQTMGGRIYKRHRIYEKQL